MVAVLILIRIMVVIMKIIKNNNNSILYAVLPFISGNLFSLPDTLSGLNKMLVGVVTIISILLYCFINLVGYFACIYIIKHTDLAKKYPKFSPIIKYYERRSSKYNIYNCRSNICNRYFIIGFRSMFAFIVH